MFFLGPGRAGLGRAGRAGRRIRCWCRAVVEDYADCALASSLLLHSTVVAVAAAALVLPLTRWLARSLVFAFMCVVLFLLNHGACSLYCLFWFFFFQLSIDCW